MKEKLRLYQAVSKLTYNWNLDIEKCLFNIHILVFVRYLVHLGCRAAARDAGYGETSK